MITDEKEEVIWAEESLCSSLKPTRISTTKSTNSNSSISLFLAEKRLKRKRKQITPIKKQTAFKKSSQQQSQQQQILEEFRSCEKNTKSIRKEEQKEGNERLFELLSKVFLKKDSRNSLKRSASEISIGTSSPTAFSWSNAHCYSDNDGSAAIFEDELDFDKDEVETILSYYDRIALNTKEVCNSSNDLCVDEQGSTDIYEDADFDLVLSQINLDTLERNSSNTTK